MKRALAVAMLFGWVLGVLAPQPSAAAEDTWELWFLPPARPVNSSAHSDTAKLTGDWHASTLSGDPNRNRDCVPSEYGWATCSALDWNDGSGAVGDPAYFRAFGYLETGDITWPGALVRLTSGTSGCATYLRATITAVATGAVVGEMVYQHVEKDPSLSGFVLGFSNGGLWGRLNDQALGTLKKDGSACWGGPHVHEDDDARVAAYNWKFWNYSYSEQAGNRFEVDVPQSWTRWLAWTTDEWFPPEAIPSCC
ncbi:MAG: hypothetical protein HY775_01250 [Acidobacteria bacterium]|nr:hypothetical protein [Acidobacteriota bacterium]